MRLGSPVHTTWGRWRCPGAAAAPTQVAVAVAVTRRAAATVDVVRLMPGATSRGGSGDAQRRRASYPCSDASAASSSARIFSARSSTTARPDSTISVIASRIAGSSTTSANVRTAPGRNAVARASRREPRWPSTVHFPSEYRTVTVSGCCPRRDDRFADARRLLVLAPAAAAAAPRGGGVGGGPDGGGVFG